MLTDAERMRLKKLFSDTISLLCRSGLPGACAHRVDALIGVTLENQEVVLVNFSENFWQESEHAVHEVDNEEKKAEKQPSPTPELCDTPEACNYGVKDECKDDQELSSAPAFVVPDQGYRNDINMHDNYNDQVERMELQCKEEPVNRYCSADDRLLLKSVDERSASESDSECVLIKAELKDDAAGQNDFLSENFIESSSDGIDQPSMPTVRGSSHSSLSTRMKYVHNMQRLAWRNTFGYKFCRPQQRYNTTLAGLQVGLLFSNRLFDANNR